MSDWIYASKIRSFLAYQAASLIPLPSQLDYGFVPLYQNFITCQLFLLHLSNLIRKKKKTSYRQKRTY